MSETKSGRGFASMDRERQREIASRGGKAAHAKGTAHEYDAEEGRKYGKLGGVAVSKNKEHMAAIGKRGGTQRALNMKARGHSHAATDPRSRIPEGEMVTQDSNPMLFSE